MKNQSHDSWSFPLLVLVILAGVIAAFVDPSAKASSPPKTTATAAAVHPGQSSD